jgi:hypothetical protein
MVPQDVAMIAGAVARVGYHDPDLAQLLGDKVGVVASDHYYKEHQQTISYQLSAISEHIRGHQRPCRSIAEAICKHMPSATRLE